MKKLFIACICLALLVACQEEPKVLTPEMEKEAKSIVLTYLEKHQLPKEGLAPFNSKAQPKPDFGYLYTGGGRCIEFIVNCYGQSCKELMNYPYDEHGDECP